MKRGTMLIIAGVVVLVLVIGWFIKEAMKKYITGMLPVDDIEKNFDRLVENQKAITEFLAKDSANKYLELDPKI